MSSAFLWLRNDLRILDQPLVTATPRGQTAVWIYVFDPRFFSREVPLPGEIAKVPKASARRALFVLQSVRDLSTRLRENLNADLLVRIGDPAQELCKCADELSWNSWDVYCEIEIGTEEQSVQDSVSASAASRGGQLHATWGYQFLYHPDDVKGALAVDPSSSLVNPHHFWTDDADPEAMVHIREEIGYAGSTNTEQFLSKLAPNIVDPASLLSLPEAEALVRLGYASEVAYSACIPDPRAVLRFQGGESAAIERLDSWIESGGLAGYYDNRSGLLGANYSSKLSPWLSAGCISAVRVYRRIRAEGYDDSIKWLISELGWRDLFRYHAIFHGSHIFQAGGPAKAKRLWLRDKQLFQAWSSGSTGIPYIDAHMRELSASGFMSNTGRQLVAAFLSCCLGLDWRLGAMWFEATLIDHDVALNYGNWNRETRIRWNGRRCEPDTETIFDEEHTHLMARLEYAAKGGEGPYDTASFIRLWVPELQHADASALLSRREPPPVYEILCSSCLELDRMSKRQNGKLLCTRCSDSCAWCRDKVIEAPDDGRKRKRYCNDCWQHWEKTTFEMNGCAGG